MGLALGCLWRNTIGRVYFVANVWATLHRLKNQQWHVGVVPMLPQLSVGNGRTAAAMIKTTTTPAATVSEDVQPTAPVAAAAAISEDAARRLRLATHGRSIRTMPAPSILFERTERGSHLRSAFSSAYCFLANQSRPGAKGGRLLVLPSVQVTTK